MTPDMKPIIEVYQQQVNDFYEGEVMKAVHKIYVNVDKDRLVKAITDAKAFYEEGYMDALSALRQQETVSNRNGLNEPLTLDELRKMDGEPVFLVDLVHKSDPKVPDLCGGWIVFTKHDQNGFIPRGGGFFSNDGYGKNWLSYRQKPKEETV